MSPDDLKERLSPLAYDVTQNGGTEYAGTGRFYKHNADGVYECVCCGAALFRSDAKYHSGSGWPSYWEPVSPDAIKTIVDNSHGMVRKEARCAACNAHLGHIFDDGPQDKTGMRYCINSCAMQFDGETG